MTDQTIDLTERDQRPTSKHVVYASAVVPFVVLGEIPLLTMIVLVSVNPERFKVEIAYCIAMGVGSAIGALVHFTWLAVLAFSCHSRLWELFCCPCCQPSFAVPASEDTPFSLEEAWTVSGWQREKLPAPVKIAYVALVCQAVFIVLAVAALNEFKVPAKPAASRSFSSGGFQRVPLG